MSSGPALIQPPTLSRRPRHRVRPRFGPPWLRPSALAPPRSLTPPGSAHPCAPPLTSVAPPQAVGPAQDPCAPDSPVQMQDERGGAGSGSPRPRLPTVPWARFQVCSCLWPSGDLSETGGSSIPGCDTHMENGDLGPSSLGLWSGWKSVSLQKPEAFPCCPCNTPPPPSPALSSAGCDFPGSPCWSPRRRPRHGAEPTPASPPSLKQAQYRLFQPWKWTLTLLSLGTYSRSPRGPHFLLKLTSHCIRHCAPRLNSVLLFSYS